MIITLYRGRIEAEKGYSSPVLHSCPLKEFGAKANQFLITFSFSHVNYPALTAAIRAPIEASYGVT